MNVCGVMVVPYLLGCALPTYRLPTYLGLTCCRVLLGVVQGLVGWGFICLLVCWWQVGVGVVLVKGGAQEES